MACLMGGFLNKEIGQMFGISPRTVKFHVANILHRIQYKNRKRLQVIQNQPLIEEIYRNHRKAIIAIVRHGSLDGAR